MEHYLDRITAMVKRFEEINTLLADPDVINDMEKYTELLKERSSLEEVDTAFAEYNNTLKEIDEWMQYRDSGDSEMAEMAGSELENLNTQKESLEKKLTFLLIPKDPADDNNAIIEIRAGTGGDEAALFAGDLFRMYIRYADNCNWKTEVLEENETDLGGFKEVILKIKGKGAFGKLKYESGVHRVQRVPSTEAGGRIHTSSASVIVLPEITNNIEVEINSDDLRIDVYRASGAGGQHVNRTESAVRITHLPTGIVVTCQNDRSQHQNKAQAMSVLKSKLYEMERVKREGNLSQKRKSLIGTGDRSEKIRTYNFPQSRITDHRIGFTSYRLNEMMNGAIDELLDILREEYIRESLKED